MKAAVLIASLVAMALAETTMPMVKLCEDAPIDCATKNKEMNICDDPIDSVAYCPRFCGLCQGPTPEPVCRDFDMLCPTLVNSQYCQKDIARQLCAESCGFCPTTTLEPTTTPIRFTEIPDPKCQDIDPDCITLLQIHYCGEEPIVSKLCRRSCNECPTITVQVTGNPGVQPGVSTQATTRGPTTPKECRDYDAICADPSTASNCTTDNLVRLLCPVTCGVCTPSAGTTLPGLPNLNPFIPGEDNCYDNDPDCASLIQSHSCETDQIVTRLCPASCQLCQPGLTTPSGNAGTNVTTECKDYSIDCPKLAPSCSFDALVVRLCRQTCNADPCPPRATTMGAGGSTPGMTTANPGAGGSTPMPEVTTVKTPPMTTPAAQVTTAKPVASTTQRLQLPSLNPFTSTGLCEDLDPECDKLVNSFSCDTNELLRRICPSACGQCVKTTPSSMGNVTSGPLTCRDFDPQCPDLANYCMRDDLLVNRLCRLTCNLCDSNLTVPTPKPTEAGPLRCRVCVDPFCEREIESVKQCPDELPFCSTQVINNADGTRGLTKRCAAKDECDGWYTGEAAGNATICANYDPSAILQEAFICYYCCTASECNKHAKPDPDSLYTPS